MTASELADPSFVRVWEFINTYATSNNDVPPSWDVLITKYPQLANTRSFELPVDLAVSRLHEALHRDQHRQLVLRMAAALDSDDVDKHRSLLAEAGRVVEAYDHAKAGDTGFPDVDVEIDNDVFFDESNQMSALWAPVCPKLADALDGGFRPGTMNIVAADAGVGKSMWLLARAVEAAEQNLNVLFVSLEMPVSECSARINNMICGVDASTMPLTLRKQHVKSWLEAHKGSLRLRDDTSYTPSPENIRRALNSYDVVCVDYGGLMVNNEGITHADSHNVAEEIVVGLLSAIRRYDGTRNPHKAVLLVAAQLSKAAKPVRKKEDAGYNVPHAAGTYAWGRSVHCFLTLHSQGLPEDLRLNVVEKHRSYKKSKPWYTRMSPTTGDFSAVSDEQARQEIDHAQAQEYDY